MFLRPRFLRLVASLLFGAGLLALTTLPANSQGGAAAKAAAAKKLRVRHPDKWEGRKNYVPAVFFVSGYGADRATKIDVAIKDSASTQAYQSKLILRRPAQSQWRALLKLAHNGTLNPTAWSTGELLITVNLWNGSDHDRAKPTETQTVTVYKNPALAARERLRNGGYGDQLTIDYPAADSDVNSVYYCSQDFIAYGSMGADSMSGPTMIDQDDINNPIAPDYLYQDGQFWCAEWYTSLSTGKTYDLVVDNVPSTGPISRTIQTYDSNCP
jgi:hypothetical protein